MLVLLLALFACSSSPAPAPTPPRVDAERNPALEAHARLFERQVLEPAPGVHVAVGYALANVIWIEAPEGLIVVDTTEGATPAREVLAEIRARTDAPIAAVILTHNHADHVFGSAVFAEGGVPVYAHATTSAHIDRVVNVLRDAIAVRSARMFGSVLPEADKVADGIGMQLRFDPADIALARPTETFTDRLEVDIAGERVVLEHAPGETDDQLLVWLPDRGVLLPGDNIYQAFPNLYTIRGTSHRALLPWVASLDRMRDLGAEVLVPSHTHPVSGAAEVQEVLTAYRDAIQYVHDQTVRGINAGHTPDTLAATIALPPHLADHPWLQEHYGRVPWSVRAVYTGYLGWYGGDPTTLEPLPPAERSRRYVEAMAAGTPLPEQARAALQAGEVAWAAELAGHWVRAEPGSAEAKALLADALDGLARGHVNPNAWNWYRTVAGELRGDLSVEPAPPNAAPVELIDSLPIERLLGALPVRLRAEEVLDTERVAVFTFTDVDRSFTLHVRRGVAELRERDAPDADLRIETTTTKLKRLLSQHVALTELPGSATVVEGTTIELLELLSWFR